MTRDTRRPISFALALATLAMAAACSHEAAEEVETETVVTVKTAAAKRGTIRGVVHATGVVSPAAGADMVVVAPESARIAEIPHAAGDRVRRGDVLVRFEIPNAAAEVQKQQAEVSRGQAALDNARAAQTRARELFDRGVAARREVEEATRALAEAEATLAEARAALAAAQEVAARSTVRAGFDGIIARRMHNPGDLVEASAGDPVLRVVDPKRLEIVAAVPLADAPRVEVGALAHLAGGTVGGREIALKVLSRPAAVDAGTATVPVRLGLTGDANFPVGMPVQVDIEADEHQDVVLIPAVAIVREADETAVFVAADGKARRRAVTLGLADGTRVEIVSGVNAGDLVIVDGQAGLPDEAAITVSQDEPGKEPAAKPPVKGREQ